MRDEYQGYDLLEHALANIFDESPGLKSSSVIHKPGVGSGIQIGSRRVPFESFDGFIEEVKLATLKLSKTHLKVVYEWYRANQHENGGDFGTKLREVSFHNIRLEALEIIAGILAKEDQKSDAATAENSEKNVSLEPGDPLQIISGSLHLVGQIIYFDKFEGKYNDRLLCNYFIKGQRAIIFINIDEVRFLY